jgi:uncharacterized RDD family membrane protein YckC
MKCPKCGYLGFESVDRCRNCGYDFSLTPTADLLELPLKTPATPSSPWTTSRASVAADPDLRQPLHELSFLDAAVPSEPVRFSSTPKPDGPRDTATPPASGAMSISADLPLFGAMIPDDLPLITRPSQPRPPLAVRRATPEMPRLRNVSARGATLDLGLEPSANDAAAGVVARSIEATDDEEADQDATLAARFGAFVTDMTILAAIDVAVVHFTLQICGIGIQEIGILPRAPLLAFLFVQNGGYLVALTAGGQTLGKMAAGIKVVSAEPRSSLDLGRAFIRELVWLALAAPAGLGLLTVLSRDHRGVHDRFAGTRVVRA